MHKAEKINPHFNQVTTNQEWFSVDGETATSLSLWQSPTTPNHFATEIETTGRKVTSTFDINQIRQVNAEKIAQITLEYSTHWIAQSEEEPGIQVENRIVNYDGEDGTIGVMTSWSTDAEWENEKGIIEALAVQYPTHKIVYLVTPGMGESSKLTKERRKTMVESGSFDPMTEQIYSALKTTDLTFDVLLGISEGGRMAISLAKKVGAKTVVTIDPPGTREQSLPVFAKKFAIDEGAGQKKVLEHSPDKLMATAHKDIDSKKLASYGLMTIFKRNLLARAHAISKQGLPDDVRTATSSGVEIIDYRARGSTFADTDVAVELAKTTPGYNAVVLDNAPHGIVEGNPYAVVSLLRQAISMLASKKIR